MPILIKGSGGAQEAPVVSVSSSGLITATAGDETTTKQLSSADDADFIASNIKSGVTIFGLSGSLQETVCHAAAVQANGNGTSTIQFSVSNLGISSSDKIISLALLNTRRNVSMSSISSYVVMNGFAKNDDIDSMTLYTSEGSVQDASVSFSSGSSSWFSSSIETITITSNSTSVIYESQHQSSFYVLVISYVS